MKKNPLDPHDAPTNRRPTRKKRRKSNEPEMLSRNVEITGVSTTVRLNAVHHKGAEPYVESQPWLELRGRATEPVNGVTDVKISMWLRETTERGYGTAGFRRRGAGREAGALVRALVAAGRVRPGVGAGAKRSPQVRARVLHEAALQLRPRRERIIFQ
jgi:hypothetical protein